MVSNDHQGQAQAADLLAKTWMEQIAADSARCGNGVYRFRGELGDFFDPRCLLGDPLGVLARAIEDSAVISLQLAQSAFRLIGPTGLPTLQGLTEDFDLSPYLSVEPLRLLIEKNIDLGRIARSDRKLRVIASNWERGEVTVFRNEELAAPDGHKAILASAAMPGFFPPVEVDGEVCVDGGVIMNTPLVPAIRAEADVIHMIYLDPDPRQIPVQQQASLLDSMDRMLAIQFAIKIKEDIATLDWINRGLEVVEKASRNEPLVREEERSFVRVAAQFARRIGEGLPYRKITLHRYFPKKDIPGGLLGYLDYEAGRIEQLIQRGRADAAEHDCTTNGCLLPEQEPKAPASAPPKHSPGAEARRGGKA